MCRDNFALSRADYCVPDVLCDQTIRNALAVTLPQRNVLERRLNRAFTAKLPKTLFRKCQMKIHFLLMDEGFYNVEMILYLKRTKVGFIIPVMVWKSVAFFAS